MYDGKIQRVSIVNINFVAADLIHFMYLHDEILINSM